MALARTSAAARRSISSVPFVFGLDYRIFKLGNDWYHGTPQRFYAGANISLLNILYRTTARRVAAGPWVV